MKDTLLIELLTEELPPKALLRISQTLSAALLQDLRQDTLAGQDSIATAYATPRRLAVSITHVLDKGSDQALEISGPSVKAGLGADGKPTQALAGFAKKNGVSVDDLVQIDAPKGKIFACRKSAAGAHLETNLALKIEAALKRLPIPKVMRWGDGDAQFVRPVHGLVMLHGAHVVPGKVLGLESTNHTQGHRFLSSGPIIIKHADDYERILREEGRVVASFEVRRSEIVKKLGKVAGQDATLIDDDALLDEVTALVEAPTVYEGQFSAEFLDVPQECLILSMKQHQKYFPLFDKTTGRLLPRFLVVSNIKTSDASNIIRGNERVLRARLSDAKFFYDQDRKLRLEERVPQLAQVVYHNKLGSQFERVERIRLLAGKIARMLGADPLLAERAAWLSKADLITGMVGEFPELQGVMGRYYALHDNEPQAVADAVGAHYQPRFAGDRLPEGTLACAVALADKLDTLAGLFGIGQQPSGEKDPFGLRRAALGVLRILVEHSLPLSLHELVNAAFAGYAGRVGGAHTDLETFIFDRFAGYLKERGYSTLEVDSVLCMNPVRINLVPQQLDAVRAFLMLPEAESLAAANKRVANILRQAQGKGESFQDAEASMLKDPAERALFDALKITSTAAASLFKQGDFTGYLKSFAVLKSPVDAFFDSVMVMVDDPGLRQNRLALLSDLRTAMNQVADISRLAA
ncbi:MAG: glycine--tRNA ligase subunit beta [Pseudomonadota bacterium]